MTKKFPYQYWNFCHIKEGYSGVAVWSKFKPILVRKGIGGNDDKGKHDKEGRVLTLEFE